MDDDDSILGSRYSKLLDDEDEFERRAHRGRRDRNDDENAESRRKHKRVRDRDH
jgi:hypothetical protein